MIFTPSINITVDYVNNLLKKFDSETINYRTGGSYYCNENTNYHEYISNIYLVLSNYKIINNIMKYYFINN